jgi:uncharacterized protein (DUF697 family)
MENQEDVKENTTVQSKTPEPDSPAFKEPAEAELDKIINHHVLGAAGIGLLPLPLVDLVALTGVQLNMLRLLAKAYGQTFSQDLGKNVIGSLVGGGFSVSISSLVYSLIKAIPLIGQTTGALALPLAAGATTYALGKVFVMHFASGGTFLNFDPNKVKEHYNAFLKKGQQVVADLKKEDTKTA